MASAKGKKRSLASMSTRVPSEISLKSCFSAQDAVAAYMAAKAKRGRLETAGHGETLPLDLTDDDDLTTFKGNTSRGSSHLGPARRKRKRVAYLDYCRRKIEEEGGEWVEEAERKPQIDAVTLQKGLQLEPMSLLDKVQFFSSAFDHSIIDSADLCTPLEIERASKNAITEEGTCCLCKKVATDEHIGSVKHKQAATVAANLDRMCGFVPRRCLHNGFRWTPTPERPLFTLRDISHFWGAQMHELHLWGLKRLETNSQVSQQGWEWEYWVQKRHMGSCM